MQNELLEKVTNLIKNNENQIKLSLNGNPLFGAVGGSISLNMANTISDIDLYIVTKDDTEEILQSVIIGNKEKVKLDCMCVKLDELIKECNDYVIQKHKYPTRFYRNQNETAKIVFEHDLYRPTFKREMVMRIFMADNIIEFEKGIARECYGSLMQGLKLIDIWDAHFNRAYGNYYEKIKNQEKVLLRKYLYTIHEIIICHFIAIEKKRPIMNFMQIFEMPYRAYIDEIDEICDTLWRNNAVANQSKEKIYLPANETLNHWIETRLGEVLCEMKQYERYLSDNFLLLD